MSLESIFVHKKSLDEYLTALLNKKKMTLGAINSWGAESITRLLPYMITGKSVRGSLAIFSYTMFARNCQIKIALPIAAGLELIHAGALIHDDVMDQDDMRRHMKAMHRQFDQFSPDKRFGESMAINIGDLCFFLAFEQFASMSSPNIAKLIALASREFSAVTIGQQFDVASSYVAHQSTEDEILSLYKYKTARYTFSLPLMMGALLASTDDATLTLLEKIGESTGILFQIRDDELNIVGDPAKTGKSIGSDRKNHKQTLQATTLIKKQYNDEAVENIQRLNIEEEHKLTLIDLVAFCGSREA